MKGVIFAFLAIAAVDAATRITTPPRKFEVRVGDSVDLPCNVEGMNKDENVVVWMRGDKMLSLDSEVMAAEDPRLAINVEGYNYTLTISSLEPFDTADYECSVTVEPKVSIYHKVQVIVPPSVKINGDPAVLVQVGEDVHVKCSATGNPVPRIAWRRLEGRMPADASHSHHGSLHIRRAQVADSGFYECTGSNGVPPDESARVEIKVQANDADDDTDANNSKPWVTTDHTYIPVRRDEDLNITCKYDGVPSPQTDWLHNNFQIAKNPRFKNFAQYSDRQSNYSQTTLVLRNVTEDIFGDYICRVHNQLGTVEAKIHVSGMPGPPAINLKDDGTLWWTVKSLEPITEYKVLYRLSSDDLFNQEKVFRSAKSEQHGDLWEKAVPLDFLKEDTDYEVQVQAKNRLGWGALAQDYVKYTSPKANTSKSKKSSDAAPARSRTSWTLIAASVVTAITARVLSR